MAGIITPPGPSAATCLNGGTLGNGSDARLMLVTRGATRLLTELFPQTAKFTRVLHATSEFACSGVIGGRPDLPDDRGWSEVVPWATEFMVMWDGRDAWGGPVTEAFFGVGKVDCTGADLSGWYDRRVNPGAIYTGMDATDIFVALHDAAMAPDPIPNFIVSATPTGQTTDRTYEEADQGYISDDLHELGDTYIDWTIYSRTLIVGGPDLHPDSFIMLTDEMWSTPPQVKIRGNEQATQVVVKGADGLVSVATASDEYVNYYGLLVRVFEESGISDQTSLDANARTRLASLQNPLYIEPPSNATLLPTAPIRMENLIPGMRVRVHATATPFEVISDFRLASVTAEFGGKVSVTLEPLGSVESL